MSIEVIQNEVAQWPPEKIRELQGYLVALNHQRQGRLDQFASKLDAPQPDQWFSLEEAERRLGLGPHDDGRE
jgi:hypothetical protein